MRHQLASWWQIEEAARGLSSTRRLGTVLVDLGILSDEERGRLIRDQLRGIVIDALGWRFGTYRFTPDAPALQESITLDWEVADAFLSEARQVDDEEELWRSVGGPEALIAPPGADGDLPRDLDAIERRIAAAADGTRRVSEVARAAAAPLPIVLRTLAALARLRARPTSALGPSQTPDAVPGVGGMSLRPGTPGAEGDRTGRTPWVLPVGLRAERAAVLDLADRLNRVDLYQLLGVGPDASTEAIRRAFTVRSQRFHPQRSRQAGMADLRTDLVRLHLALLSAHATLSDPEMRTAYDRRREARARLRDPRQRAREESCREHLDRGTRLIREGRFGDAIPPLREAVRLRPELGVARYRLGQCLATVPGGVAEAKEHLRRAAELEPRNPRYAEAFRSLSTPAAAPRRPGLGRRLSRWLTLPRDGQER